MPDENVLTRHPQGKSGRSISKQTYDLFESTLLGALKGKELTHSELMAEVNDRLAGKFEGNIGWYAETMKLDMEARGLIERTPSKPQRYRTVK